MRSEVPASSAMRRKAAEPRAPQAKAKVAKAAKVARRRRRYRNGRCCCPNSASSCRPATRGRIQWPPTTPRSSSRSLQLSSPSTSSTPAPPSLVRCVLRPARARGLEQPRQRGFGEVEEEWGVLTAKLETAMASSSPSPRSKGPFRLFRGASVRSSRVESAGSQRPVRVHHHSTRASSSRTEQV